MFILLLVSWVKYAAIRRIPRKVGPDPGVVSLALGVVLTSFIFGFTKLITCTPSSADLLFLVLIF